MLGISDPSCRMFTLVAKLGLGSESEPSPKPSPEPSQCGISYCVDVAMHLLMKGSAQGFNFILDAAMADVYRNTGSKEKQEL